MNAPAFQFYVADFLVGTADMSQAEVGAYIRLLCHQWNRGSLPVEPEKLQRLAGGSVSDDVLKKFPVDPDGERRNARLERERVKKDAFHERQRKKGLLSAKSRAAARPRLNRGSDPVDVRLQPESNSSSSSSSSNNTLRPADAVAVELETEKSTEPTKPRPRDPVFDALAEAEGSKVDQLTKAGGAVIGKSAAEIRRVSPDVTAAEISRRAANYALLMPPGTRLTAAALAKHWARCDQAPLKLNALPRTPDRNAGTYNEGLPSRPPVPFEP